MSSPSSYYSSSIGKKQVVAVTGLLLILFVIAHLLGNFLFYLGPEAFNDYAKKLASLRPGLLVAEAGLCLIFIIHLYTTALLVMDNLRARAGKYAVEKSKGAYSLSSRLMSVSGTIVFAFVVWHLLDFTFIDKHGPRSVLADGQSYGLYGIVYNSFSDPLHSGLYIIAMIAIGMHLSHGLQSFVQTFGLCPSEKMSSVQGFSNSFGWLIAIGYSSIPVYVLILNIR